MRKLTIKRRKAFVASSAIMQVYIEDPNSDEMMINGLNCRKLGDIKNGEEREFEVGENNLKVFVINEKSSKNYCNEYYNIPQGSEDLILSGKNTFNLFSGVYFRFDGEVDEIVIGNRRKSKMKAIILLFGIFVVSFTLSYVIGLNYCGPKDNKKFETDKYSITLTKEFEEILQKDCDVYESKKVRVEVKSIEFDALPKIYKENEKTFFGYITENETDLLEGKNISALRNESGLYVFDYDYEDKSGVMYKYYSYIFKGENEFFKVDFITRDINSKKYKSDFFDWAKTFEIVRNNIKMISY